MKIGILGIDQKARALGKVLTRNGYHIMFGNSDIAKANELAGEMDRYARGGTIANTIHYGEVICLTFPFKEFEVILRNIDTYRGKIIIDCTNPFTSELGEELIFGHSTSGAEQLAGMVPEASIVKAFNTAFEEHIEEGPYFGSNDASMFYCGDDIEAKNITRKIIEDVGFEPIDAGSLKSARMLEPMGKLLVQLSRDSDIGREIGFKLLRR